jgi:hypothetical protein
MAAIMIRFILDYRAFDKVSYTANLFDRKRLGAVLAWC